MTLLKTIALEQGGNPNNSGAVSLNPCYLVVLPFGNTLPLLILRSWPLDLDERERDMCDADNTSSPRHTELYVDCLLPTSNSFCIYVHALM